MAKNLFNKIIEGCIFRSFNAFYFHHFLQFLILELSQVEITILARIENPSLQKVPLSSSNEMSKFRCSACFMRLATDLIGASTMNLDMLRI